MAALACGMIAVGSCNGEVTSTIIQTMMERPESDLKDTYARYLALGLALTYLGKSLWWHYRVKVSGPVVIEKPKIHTI